MADIDLFTPEVSKIIKGIEGKSVLLYGPNKCGKTYNAVKAPKPLVLAFEKGLSAIDGVPYLEIRTWSDFRKIVKQLSDRKNFDKLHEKYKTIIVDAIDGIEKLSDHYVCGLLGINTLREYNGGYGAWKEWEKEIDDQLHALCCSGFTIIFLGHEGSRKFTTESGQEYEMVYPRGDKRVVNPILNYVDITGYIRLADATDTGAQPLSTLYLLGNRSFFAGGRFMNITPVIPEWNYDKFEKALVAAIEKIEKDAAGPAISIKEAMAIEDAKKKEEDKSKLPIDTLKARIGAMVKQSTVATGNRDEYISILSQDVGDPNFKCNSAGENQRMQLEIVYASLLAKGYTYSAE